MKLTPTVRGVILQLTAMGLYATHDAVIKLLGSTYPALQVLFFSSLLSFPLVSMILLQDPHPGTLRPHHPGWVAVRTVCAIISGMAGFYAFSALPLAQVYAILFATPLLVTILSIPLLGEQVGLHRWAAVIVGLTGVLIVVRPGVQPLQLGHFAAMLGACSGAMAAVLIRKIGTSERPLVLIMWPMLGNFVVTGAALSFDYEPMALHHFALTGLIAALGLAGSFLVIMAYRSAEAAVIAPMQYSQIIWATIYGAFLFNEILDLPTMIGALVIIASGIYIVWREGISGNSANRPVLAARLRQESVTAPKSTLLGRLWHPRS